jgi:hypothetical protein
VPLGCDGPAKGLKAGFFVVDMLDGVPNGFGEPEEEGNILAGWLFETPNGVLTEPDEKGLAAVVDEEPSMMSDVVPGSAKRTLLFVAFPPLPILPPRLCSFCSRFVAFCWRSWSNAVDELELGAVPKTLEIVRSS